MNHSVSPAVWAALHQLTATYWERVDRISTEPVADLYTENGEMLLGSLRCSSRDEIRTFFVRRDEGEIRTRRTTRHCVGNLTIAPLDNGRCRIRSTVLVLAGTGDWPMASLPPSSVADFEDVVVETSESQWLFESRIARVAFVGEGAASFAR